ncbi:MAG: ATP-binding protein [Actinomycetota bacterium]|nr:ATP-binding protein [Actinomycetota bacterium]
MPPPPCDRGQPTPRADRESAGNDEPQKRPPVAFHLVLAAEPAALSLIRGRLRQWLKAYQWPDAELEDLVLAVSEAASNAVEHAYPPGVLGNVEVGGRVIVVPDGSWMVELTVRDHGCWRPIPERSENRRRGIPLMKATLAELVIDGTDQGTCVSMRSRSVGR